MPTTEETTTYLLRDIPDDLWRQAKSLAASRGESLRDVLLRLVAEYVKKGKK